jgi:nitrite reductase (NADH) small subunit
MSNDVKWIEVGSLDDVPVRGSRRIAVPGGAIAVFRTADDRVFALDDKCPHLGGPLSQGIVHDAGVTCPLHNWVIDLESGRARGADEGCVRTVPVRNEGGRILIGLKAAMQAA